MPKIQCGWVACIYNDSEVIGGMGNCSAKQVVYNHLLIDCPELEDEEELEALECKTFKRGKKEFREG